jgi:hypothetical protein
MKRDCRIDVWLTEAMAAELVELARQEDRAVSATARKLIELSLAHVRAMRAPQPAPRPNGHHQQQYEGQPYGV